MEHTENTHSTAIIKFLFRQDGWKVMDEIIGIKDNRKILSFYEFENLYPFVLEQESSLIICSIRDKNDLLELAMFIRGIQKAHKDHVRIVVVNFTGSSNVDRIVSQLGIHDVLTPETNKKSLRHKLDLWLRSLDVQAQAKKNELNKHRSRVNRLFDEKASLADDFIPLLAAENGALFELPESPEVQALTEEPKITSSVRLGSIDLPCILEDIFETTITLRVVDEFNPGDQVILELMMDHKNTHLNLKTMGTVSSQFSNDEGECYIDIKIGESDAPYVDELMLAYQRRQLDISTFMNFARGR